MQKNVNNNIKKWKKQDNITLYDNDHGEKQWTTQIKDKLFMGKGNIFVLINIDKKSNQGLDVESLSSQCVFPHFYKLYDLSKFSLIRPYSFPPTPGMIPTA